jgi:HPt (histidine-containing phosphotransfer) domain-containing protein
LADILQQNYKQPISGYEDNNNVSEKIIDFEVLGELEKYGGKELITETLEDFRQEADQLIKSCGESFNFGDYDDILAKLHTLKGNASTLGISRMARLAKITEADLKQKKKSRLKEQLAELQEAFSEFEQAFTDFINTTKNG